MERPTIEVVLPESKAKVVMFTFLRNGDFRKIQRRLFEGVTIDLKSGSEPELNKLQGSTALDHQEMVLSLLISEAFLQDGSRVDSLDQFVYDLSIEDANILYAKADELSNSSKLSAEAKKK